MLSVQQLRRLALLESLQKAGLAILNDMSRLSRIVWGASVPFGFRSRAGTRTAFWRVNPEARWIRRCLRRTRIACSE